MALDIFALLTSDGDHAQADHMFTGKAGDMVAVADVLDAVHCANRRLRAVPALASRFRNGATYPIPCVRLTKAECASWWTRSPTLANPCPRPPKPANSLTCWPAPFASTDRSLSWMTKPPTE